jgi:hypothetical protein
MSAAVDGPYAPTLEVTISTGAFDSNWANCERVASYLARAVSHNRRDSLLHYNLLSSALNEILELAFRSHAPGAAITCSLLRKEGLDRVVLSVPGNEELSTAYRKMVGDAGRDNSAQRLASEILAGVPASAGLSLMELAANYKAEFRLEISDDRRISLVTDLALEDDDL